MTLVYSLLPGFITAWVLYGLTPLKKGSPFERVIVALIFTVLVNAIVAIIEVASLWIGSAWFTAGTWTPNSSLVASVVVALSLGVLFARWTNNDTLHGLLRESDWIPCYANYLRLREKYPRLPDWGWASSSSRQSNWFTAFFGTENWIVLHLKDGRRLLGWPRYWPDHSDEDHFILELPRWLDGEGTMLPQASSKILIAATDVEFVEFLDDAPQPAEGSENEPAVDVTVELPPIALPADNNV